MPYSSTTRATLRARVQERLIPTFWGTTELNVYVNEALRVWNVLTGYNRNITSSVIVAPFLTSCTTFDITQFSPNGLLMLRLEVVDLGTHLDTLTFKELDELSPTWLSTGTGAAPTGWMHAGMDNILIYPNPDGDYTYSAYTIDKMTIPTTDIDYIQVGEEDMPAIVDYITFIARLKEGGKETQDAQSLLQSFIKAASRYNAKILGTSIYRRIMGLSPADQSRPPRLDNMPPR